MGSEAATNTAVTPTVGEPLEASGWPAPDGRRVVFLLDAASALECRLLEDWIREHQPGEKSPTWDAVRIPSSRRRSRRESLDPNFEGVLASEDDPLLAPLRIAWNPRRYEGGSRPRWSELALGDPRDPGPLRQVWLARRDPESYRVVVAEPAPLSELRARWHEACGTTAEQTTGLGPYVVMQATLALERAERRLRGARYKVPRLVREDILARPAFRAGLARIGRKIDKPLPAVQREATRYLNEIAATHSPYVIDLVAQLTHLLYSRAYGDVIHYDREQLESIYAVAQRYPVVFLPSHKSNLDHLVLQYVLHENGHPPNHTASGINMNFFPVGPLIRRSGAFFIRRSFKDNPLYKFVLRQYIDYLIEKRFSLEWYLEGGRSRSGKLLPPRFGMLAYVVDAYRRGKADDVYLVPVSIAYDQIQDVGDYVAEQRGAAKTKESFGWFVGVVRRLQRSYGGIHLRLGEPLSLRDTLGAPTPGADPDPDEKSLALRKIAFEISVRINRVTPITPTSLVTLSLLGTGDQALTIDEVQKSLANLLNYVRRRNLPTTDLDLDNPAGIRRALDFLVDTGVVACFAEGQDAVYMIGPGEHLTAAYYRNTIIHFFQNGAIAELALLGAADRDGGDPMQVFWEETLALRDLMKFELFFPDKSTFQQEIHEEISLHASDWEEQVQRDGRAEIQALVRRFKPLSAHRVLRPFLEAYRVVGDALEQRDPAEELDEGDFLNRCLALGKQYHLQRRIRSEESVSKVLFANGLRLARNRGLVEPDGAPIAERRHAFADELRRVIRRINIIEVLGASRRAGLEN